MLPIDFYISGYGFLHVLHLCVGRQGGDVFLDIPINRCDELTMCGLDARGYFYNRLTRTNYMISKQTSGRDILLRYTVYF